MTSSLLPSNPAVTSDRSSTRRKKKKKIQIQNSGENQNNDQNSSVEWKSDAQQQIYSSKLLQALRQVRQNGGAGGAGPSGPKRVHEAADRVLAATARGRTRWSRAILTNRLKLKFMKKNNIVKRQNKVMTVITSGSDRLKRKSKVTISRLKSMSLPAVQRKARVLSRLVPGCRKEPLPVVLEEATDYIAALEMQVRAMSALAELLSVSGSSSSSSTSSAAASGGGSNPFGSSSSRTRPT
ncbi:transcription factor bhlh147 [Phtheirospermum japonicum]|uniref:Transcription factor bhlh147 n=1 Tax=Phtheirospermum japonicum TaxID=374723 RepID=A0A830D6Y0_9LAMI|nr:transcription factor bhlh147 [Phtheirospermum japonicum]